MTPVVHIVDYGIGNLFSVARAVERAGGQPRLTNDATTILNASRLILPGVGAFEPCMSTLRDTGLAQPVVAFAQSGRPFLGICVGMQLLFDHSLEFGTHDGLGLIAGHVAPIPSSDNHGTRKVPHIGWNVLRLPEGRRDWQGTLLQSNAPGLSSAYFVHSYSCLPNDDAMRLADVEYGGYRICAAVQSQNITGFQCHPEKSGSAGLKIIERLLAQ
jgi:imidazole glycerol-phosphate synthase subunit HisH